MATEGGPAAAPSPFVRLLEAGWRPAGSGQWRRGEVVTTAAKALAEIEVVAVEVIAVDITEGEHADEST